ncbi:hypothetical protein GCM10027570_01290 [Streptomonospora sediminis]
MVESAPAVAPLTVALPAAWVPRLAGVRGGRVEPVIAAMALGAQVRRQQAVLAHEVLRAERRGFLRSTAPAPTALPPAAARDRRWPRPRGRAHIRHLSMPSAFSVLSVPPASRLLR